MKMRTNFLALALTKGDSLYLQRSKDGPYEGWLTLPTKALTHQQDKSEQKIFSLARALFELHIPAQAKELFTIKGIRNHDNQVVCYNIAVYRLPSDFPEESLNWGRSKLLIDIFCDQAILDPTLSLLGDKLRNKFDISEISPSYLEFPPELAKYTIQDVQQMNPESLWELSYPNYCTYLDGKAGGQGWLPKRLILEPRIEELLFTHFPNGGEILDYGGGNGSIFRDLPPSKYKIHIIDPIAKKTQNLNDKKYDVAICSLVIPWLPDLDNIFNIISSQLKTNGLMILGIPNPVTFRTGRWDSRRGTDSCYITQQEGNTGQNYTLPQ